MIEESGNFFTQQRAAVHQIVSKISGGRIPLLHLGTKLVIKVA
jgi:hypothetical protein